MWILYPDVPTKSRAGSEYVSPLILSRLISSDIHPPLIDKSPTYTTTKKIILKKTNRNPLRLLKCLLHSYPASTQCSVLSTPFRMKSKMLMPMPICARVMLLTMLHVQRLCGYHFLVCISICNPFLFLFLSLFFLSSFFFQRPLPAGFPIPKNHFVEQKAFSESQNVQKIPQSRLATTARLDTSRHVWMAFISGF